MIRPIIIDWGDADARSFPGLMEKDYTAKKPVIEELVPLTESSETHYHRDRKE